MTLQSSNIGQTSVLRATCMKITATDRSALCCVGSVDNHDSNVTIAGVSSGDKRRGSSGASDTSTTCVREAVLREASPVTGSYLLASDVHISNIV